MSSTKSLNDIFLSFRSRGERVALVYRTGIRRLVFSYADLDRLGRQMAAWLALQGVQKGDRMALWAPNSPWWAVAFWGCILRGRVVVPIDFMSGRDRAEKIIESSGAKLLIQSQYKLEKSLSSNCKVQSVNIEDLEYFLPDIEPIQDITPLQPDDLAELIYTSGTTGEPKGVMLTHKNLTANLAQVNRHIPVITDSWNFLSVLPLSHTFEQMAGFLTPLWKGASIIYLRILKPSAIMEAFAHEDVRVMPIVPRLLAALKSSIERELAAKHLSGVFRWLRAKYPGSFVFFPIKKKFGCRFQFFISGGAALPRDVAEFWTRMGFRVLEGYGITECSPVLAANVYDKQVIGSVGKPLPGVSIRIEGDEQGGAGEIVAQGDNVFAGYYQNEEATQKSFTSDGWFRTGDNGYFDAQGNLYIKGRQKEMIVTGAGVNVYPDDIEPILTAIPGVKEACVIGKKTDQGEEVHAVLILEDKQGGMDEAKKIMNQANGKLDPLQRISGVSIWPDKEFPKTSTLKIQKFKVAERLQTYDAAHGASSSSADTLISIISATTGIPGNSINESSRLVADLGLSSIARLELVNALELEFRLDLEDSAISDMTTVGGLRALIEKREKIKHEKTYRRLFDGRLIRTVRAVCDNFFHIPLLRYFISLTRAGTDNLDKITPPVIFIANHESYFDPFVIYWALPPRLRYTTASASWEGLFVYPNSGVLKRLLGKALYWYTALFSMNFVIAERQAFRNSLAHMGKLIDRNLSILIFPEGERTLDGQMKPFQPGLAVMVNELKVPVVPIKLEGLFELFPRTSAWPSRGKASIVFGKRMVFTHESPSQILKHCEQVLREL